MRRIYFSIFILFLSQMSFAQNFSYNEKRSLSHYAEHVLQAGFSPYRNFFALTIGDNSLEVYDKDWSKVYEHQGNPAAVAGVFDFSPDEKYLAYAKWKSNNDIAIIETDGFKLLSVLHEHSSHISDLCFSPDGKWLASAGSDSKVNIWERRKNSFVHVQQMDYERPVNAIDFSLNGNWLAVAGNNSKLIIYKLEGESFIEKQVIANFNGYVRDVEFYPNKISCVAGTQSYIKKFVLKRHDFILVDSMKARVNRTLSISPDGNYISYGTMNALNVVDSRDGLKRIEGIYQHNDFVFGATFSTDGKFLTTFGSDKQAIIWELKGVEPSSISSLVDYYGNPLSIAQKRALNRESTAKILTRLDAKLKAPRDEFETTSAYLERRKKLEDLTLSYLQSLLEDTYSTGNWKHKQSIKIPVDHLIAYNADLEIYKIVFMETEAGVEIPINPARELREQWEKAFIVVDKFEKPGFESMEYDDFRLYHPANDKYYPVTCVENPFHPSIMAAKSRFSDDGGKTEAKPKQPGNTKEELLIANNYALIIAGNIYDAFSDLVNPVIDANTIAEELQFNYGYSTEILENPTLNETISKIREYAERSYSDNDNLLIFIAGHGIYDEVFKEGYIISRDSKYDDVSKITYLSHSNLRTIVNNIPCRHILLLMDVCFGGTFDPVLASSSRAAGMYADVSDKEFIKRKKQYVTRLYLTSGGKEYVPDGRPGHHSPFARKLLEALRNYGGEDKILTINELLHFIEKVEPQPRFGEFGDNEPGSDFLLISK